MKFDLLWVSNVFGSPNTNAQWVENAFGSDHEPVLRRGTVLTSSVERSTIARRCVLPLGVLGNSPSRSIAMSSCDVSAGKSLISSELDCNCTRYSEHFAQLPTIW